eukprot:5577627-Prymnesium_polylepis.1
MLAAWGAARAPAPPGASPPLPRSSRARAAPPLLSAAAQTPCPRSTLGAGRVHPAQGRQTPHRRGRSPHRRGPPPPVQPSPYPPP